MQALAAEFSGWRPRHPKDVNAKRGSPGGSPYRSQTAEMSHGKAKDFGEPLR